MILKSFGYRNLRRRDECNKINKLKVKFFSFYDVPLPGRTALSELWRKLNLA